jgi:hypothetical protein
LKADVKGQAESKLIQIKAQALLLIANEYIHGLNAQVSLRPGDCEIGGVRRLE